MLSYWSVIAVFRCFMNWNDHVIHSELAEIRSIDRPQHQACWIVLHDLRCVQHSLAKSCVIEGRWIYRFAAFHAVDTIRAIRDE